MTDEVITNWRELKAGPEMSRLIAERLGWTLAFQDYWWRLVRPDGYEFEFTIVSNEAVTTDFVWTDCIRTMPRLQFSTNLNTAFTLLKQIPMGAVFMDDNFYSDGLWSCTGHMDGVGIVADEEARTAALAICRAWLAYQERKQPA